MGTNVTARDFEHIGETTWILGHWLRAWGPRLCLLSLVGEEELHHWSNWDVLGQLTQMECCDGWIPDLQERQAGRQGGVDACM